MVRTTAKTGYRAGKPLWRCTDFDCPGLENIDETDEGVTMPAPVAGESAQRRYERERKATQERIRYGAPFLFGVAGLGSLLVYWAAAVFAGPPYPALAATLLVLVLVFLIGRMTPEVLDWKRGAEAERRVGQSLDALLPFGFVVLYDRSLRGRGGNIDAVAVGPQGVFVIETKWRRRRVEVINRRLEVGGRDQPEIVRQVVDLAMAVQVSIAESMNRHRLTVVPLICIGNRSVDKGVRTSGVPVLDAKSVAAYVLALPTVFGPEDVQAVARELDYALPPFDRREQA